MSPISILMIDENLQAKVVMACLERIVEVNGVPALKQLENLFPYAQFIFVTE